MSALPKIQPGGRINLERISVLLADGNPQALDILSQVVVGFGVRTPTKCGTGVEAQDVLKRTTFDLVICDAHLPKLNGYELIRWLRREGPEANRCAPVIIVAGHTRRSDVLMARDCGANFTIVKPLTPKTILERILWVAREDRLFIESDSYAGPDRRFKRLGPPAGMEGRREDDLSAKVGLAQTPNLSQDEINSMMKPTRVTL
jgi:CheY-like chemotaxis protein